MTGVSLGVRGRGPLARQGPEAQVGRGDSDLEQKGPECTDEEQHGTAEQNRNRGGELGIEKGVHEERDDHQGHQQCRKRGHHDRGIDIARAAGEDLQIAMVAMHRAGAVLDPVLQQACAVDDPCQAVGEDTQGRCDAR